MSFFGDPFGNPFAQQQLNSNQYYDYLRRHIASLQNNSTGTEPQPPEKSEISKKLLLLEDL